MLAAAQPEWNMTIYTAEQAGHFGRRRYLMEHAMMKIRAKNTHLPLKAVPGHFATNHAHINYYIDMTTVKARQSEAEEMAKTLAGQYVNNTVVDTIVCLDGTQVIGAYLAEELSRAGFISMNEHKTIYIITPEFNSNSQMIFKENVRPMVAGKHVILLLANVTTGLTLNKALECIGYYEGILEGVAAVFSAQTEVDGVHINSVYSKEDLPDYRFYDYRNCPFCERKMKIDALVNSFGYFRQE